MMKAGQDTKSYNLSQWFGDRMRKVEFATTWRHREFLGRPAVRHSAIFVFPTILKIDFPKLNLLPKASIETFWDALWLRIRPFLCFISF